MTATLYLTGFEPFLQLETNPTEGLVHALDGETAGPLRVAGRVLPVTWADAPRVLLEDLDRLSPAMSLLLGVSGQASTLHLERFAYNAMRSSFADNAGVTLPETPIDVGAPLDQAHATSVDPEPIAARLCEAGFPAQVWDDPGRYVCNRTYYEALTRSLSPALFMHVPLTGNLDPNQDVWTWERLLEATRAALEAVATSAP